MKKINFNIVAIILIIIICVALTPITFQNDTYYTIKIGESIANNGIDMQDHFSIHENLSYTYPHWLYDLITYLIYSKFNFLGIYIFTCILSSILGITLYFTNAKICKNEIISFFVMVFIVFMIKPFITARAQLLTFTLFVLTIYFIESFLEKTKIKYAILLIIIPVLLANVHIAVFPFYFVLYVPYIAEYIIAKLYYDLPKIRLKKLEKQKLKYEKKISRYKKIIEKRSLKDSDKKIILEKNENTKKLIILFLITLFTGFLSPLGTNPYTYLIKTMLGSTTENILEHSPITLFKFPEAMIFIFIMVIFLVIRKTKIKVSELILISFLTMLTIFSQRQFSMLALLTSFFLSKTTYEIIKSNKENVIRKDITIVEAILFIIIAIMLCTALLVSRVKEKFVDENEYPVSAANYILENIDISKARFYNEYNYGSYMLFRGIDVFIDSRADLYDLKFNDNGYDIFMDYINCNNLSIYFEDVFEKYNITHIILRKDSKINLVISNIKSSKYNMLYSDENFVIYEFNK